MYIKKDDIKPFLDYLNQFKKGFRHEQKLIKFQEQMQRLANQNIYSQEITLKEPKIMRKLKPSQETIIMENIEFLLFCSIISSRDIHTGSL